MFRTHRKGYKHEFIKNINLNLVNKTYWIKLRVKLCQLFSGFKVVLKL